VTPQAHAILYPQHINERLLYSGGNKASQYNLKGIQNKFQISMHDLASPDFDSHCTPEDFTGGFTVTIRSM